MQRGSKCAKPTITKDTIIRDRDTTKLNNTPGRTRMGGLNRNDYDFKNKRAVWKISPKPFKEAHFAVYPEELCETPIKAGCPAFICKKCGKARDKIYTQHLRFESGCGRSGNIPKGKWKGKEQQVSGDYDVRMGPKLSHSFKRYSDCGCGVGFESGTVLDPFCGAGTTGLVALKQGKEFIGIELNKEYIEIADRRLKPYLEQSKLNQA